VSTKNYLKSLLDDKKVASITPTSSFAVERVLKNIDFSEAKTIVEYGPGGGVFTKSLLAKMRSDANLIAIENNAYFATLLNQQIKDSRLHIVHGSAESIRAVLQSQKLATADYIISGIPFSLFSSEMKNHILSETNACLSQNGKFLVYQFLVSLTYGKDDIKNKLAEYLVLVDRDFELFCVPPLRIFVTAKRVCP